MTGYIRTELTSMEKLKCLPPHCRSMREALLPPQVGIQASGRQRTEQQEHRIVNYTQTSRGQRIA